MKLRQADRRTSVVSCCQGVNHCPSTSVIATWCFVPQVKSGFIVAKVVDRGDGLQIRRVTENVLNCKLRTVRSIVHLKLIVVYCNTDGGGFQIWRVAANILNKQPRTAARGWSSNLGVGRGC
jgi:hypothetical protein